MRTNVGGSPRQFKVSLGLHVRHKHRRTRTTAEENKALDVRLLRNPPGRAVVPYSPKTELEDSNLRFLIYHFVTVVSASSVTNVGPRFEWFPLAVRDEAFFHAVISSTSSHAAYLQQVELPANFYFHRGTAIRLLNRRIERGAHDEGTINTVAVFSQQESFEGRAETALTHVHGLLSIVSAAGGPHSEKLSPHTRRHIYLTDLAACIALKSKPLLTPALDVSNPEKYFRKPSVLTASHARTFGARLYNYTNSTLSDHAVNVLWGLRNVSKILEAIRNGTEQLDTPSATDIQFTDRVEVLERLVHPLWYIENPASPQHPIFQTFGWTCCIYIYTILRELPKELGMNIMLANRIKTTLEACQDLNVLLATFQDLLLWQMFICGRVADFRDRPFFVQQATKILMIRKIENPEEIMAVTTAFLWPERYEGFRSEVNDEFGAEAGNSDFSEGVEEYN
ncbi:uncharacterized protein LY89DRAFT_785555 [Mollisia scopiformis]|uniref:Uncharacterized protein n=1 Tax=Mollisia scopiformis TaxID=149040 RepID=A0A194WZ90_MOLSC|nr:uncharacterized protein LY89DRAFT_785555 [Mollisia scopiformis]KUJ13029.1 hypothetical protein LY89DRAFT_785555 [Mollisia scopiformis]